MESRGILSKKELGQAEEDKAKQETIGTQQSELLVQNIFQETVLSGNYKYRT